MEGEAVKLSIIGEIVSRFLAEISHKHPGIQLDEWVIMPNHVHLILIIEHDRHTPRRVPTETELRRVPIRLQPLIKDSISSAINHFKGNVKKWCNQNGFSDFAWQARFHDHIIWNRKSLENIRQYIRDNPLNWETDEDNIL